MMARGHSKEAWGRDAVLLSLIHNVNCGKKEDMSSPDDYNPHAEKVEQPKLRVGFNVLEKLYERFQS